APTPSLAMVAIASGTCCVLRMSTGTRTAPTSLAAAMTFFRTGSKFGLSGFASNPTRNKLGTVIVNNSTCFGVASSWELDRPVMLPPGHKAVADRIDGVTHHDGYRPGCLLDGADRCRRPHYDDIDFQSHELGSEFRIALRVS